MESRNRGSELLNGPAAHTCINRRLKDMRTDDVCAVFMADLDDMPEIAEKAGKDRLRRHCTPRRITAGESTAF